MRNSIVELSLAQTLTGVDENGATLTRQWSLMFRSSSPLDADRRSLLRDACQPFLKKALTDILGGLALLPDRSEATVVAVVLTHLRTLDAAIAVLAAEHNVNSLRAHLVELPSRTNAIDLTGLVGAGRPLSLYEWLSAHASSVVAATSDSRWSNGRLFNAPPSPGASLEPGAMLDMSPLEAGASNVDATVRLMEMMLIHRSAPELQVTSAALAAAQLPTGVIEQLALGSNRVRRGAPRPISPFGPPLYSLGAGTAFAASVAVAADELLQVGSSEMGTPSYLRSLREAVTSLANDVLRHAQDLTKLQLDGKSDAEQLAARTGMKVALECAEEWQSYLQWVLEHRVSARGGFAVAVESSLQFLQSEVAAARRVIHVQDSFTNGENDAHSAVYAAVFATYALEPFSIKSGVMRLFLFLIWARHGFPKQELGVMDNRPLDADVLEKFKTRMEQVTNPGNPNYSDLLREITANDVRVKAPLQNALQANPALTKEGLLSPGKTGLGPLKGGHGGLLKSGSLDMGGELVKGQGGG